MSDVAEANAIHDFIAKAIADHPVVLFMKGVPDSPQCGFSAICVQILDHLGVDFVGVNVLQSDDLRQGIKSFSDWPTIPQLYVKGEFVGGSRHRARDVPVGRAEAAADRQGRSVGLVGRRARHKDFLSSH